MKCPNCGVEFQSELGYGKKVVFCSRKCLNTFNLKSPKSKENWKKFKEKLNAKKIEKEKNIQKAKNEKKAKEILPGKCRFCGRDCKNQNSLRQHETRCKKNPNRKTGNHGWRKGDLEYEIWLKKFRSSPNPANVHIEGNCQYCGKIWYTTVSGLKSHEKFCLQNPNKKVIEVSEEIRKKISNKLKGKTGGYKLTQNSTRTHRGYYKGIYCMSSWELAWVYTQIKNGKNVQQCREQFEYEMNGEKHMYTPDFIIDGVYYEIKNWHRPDTDFKVRDFPKDKKLILIEGKEANKVFYGPLEKEFGRKFWEVLYEDQPILKA